MNRRSEVRSIALTSSQRHNNESPTSTAVPESNLDLLQRPNTVDVYNPTSVYSEIGGSVYEPASVVDDHADDDDYDVLCAQSVQPQRTPTTVPVYLSLLSDAEAEEINTDHPSTLV